MLGKPMWRDSKNCTKSIVSIITFRSMVSSSCNFQTFSPTDKEFDFFLNDIVQLPQYPKETRDQGWKPLLWED